MSVSDPLGGVKTSDSVSLDPMQIITVDDIEFEPYIDAVSYTHLTLPTSDLV